MNREPWRLRHSAGLNGLRGIAVALVVAHHAAGGAVGPALGSVGVTSFFTLSGFLITALLLQEAERAGRVSLARFWGRRARRLFPALAVFLLVMSGLEEALLGEVGQVGPVITFTANWSAAFGRPLGGLLTHTWSLSVEEQFYAVWPLVLVLVVKNWGRNGVAVAATAGAVASFGWRTWLATAGASHARLYYGTDTRADALLVGAALAAVMLGRRWQQVPAWIAPAGVALLVVAGLTPEGTVAPVITEVVTAGVIYIVVTGSRTWLGWSPLVWLGERSYGLYLWSFPLLMMATGAVPLPHLITVPVAVGVSLLLTELSWRLVERPAQDLRRRRPNPGRGSTDPVAEMRTRHGLAAASPEQVGPAS